MSVFFLGLSFFFNLGVMIPVGPTAEVSLSQEIFTADGYDPVTTWRRHMLVKIDFVKFTFSSANG